MYVVVKVEPGPAMIELMTTLANCAMTFSVTDDLHKICASEAKKNSKEAEAQTDNGNQTDSPETRPPLTKKRKNGSDSSKSSTGNNSWKIQSFPIVNQSPTSPVNTTNETSENNDSQSPNSKTEEDFPLTTTEEQNQLIMSLFRNDLLKCEVEDSTDDFEDRGDTIRNLSNLATTTYDAETFERQMAMFSDPNSLLTDPRRSAPKKRGICQMCHREVSVISTHKRRHAITHLGIKTLRCQLCNKYFSRPDLANPHFKRDHPNSVPIAFVDTISEEDAQKIRRMMTTCFPPIAGDEEIEDEQQAQPRD
ncbi:hypothetical protein WR25_12850 [Diploscapter pachys]|uniref:C2H2-type domain-containing protein n=1 Tax=Diploscapter pachys TaxID=2018661 RepID=A0A2A2JB64_9BILA|nr:hypothetical protein WR25_12850 [Diploscapter pachys]